MNGYDELIGCGVGPIVDAAMKCEAVFSNHERAHVGISGGADSDIVIDICERVRQVQPIEIDYVFYNTGIEYAATIKHLDELEDKYGVKIMRLKAVKSVPVSCHEYGQPFASKYISTVMRRLQKIGFQWEDGTFDELWAKYGTQRAALRWWTNDFTTNDKPSRFDIDYRRHIKEFIMENHPWFPISAECCDYSKKRTAEANMKERERDLSVVGVRKAEGGGRAMHQKCFDRGPHGKIDTYRPIFWFTNADKKNYETIFDITHSDCYKVWGFTRTGCVGCPFSKTLESDLVTSEKYEPKIYRASCKVFKDSYEYTRMFNEFKRKKKEDLKSAEVKQLQMKINA